MPLLLLRFFITELLSFANPVVAYYLYCQLNIYRNTVEDDYARRCLYDAVALLLFMLLGSFLVNALLRKSRKCEEDPQLFDTNK